MSVKKNYIYNMLYQVLNIIIPMLTMPYVSRTLQANGIGINTYTLSIAQYFILFGTIGISLYGSRTIGYVRDNKEELSSTFWSIAILQITTATIALITYMIIFGLYKSEHRVIYMIQGINILAAAIDISWFFMGIEEFKKTVTRNTIVRVLAFICVFIFVKDTNDVWIYALIFAASTFFGQIIMWYYIPGIVGKPRTSFKEIKKHFLPSVRLFIPQIAIQIYVVLDKTMIGILASQTELGYFDNAEKTVKMSLTVVTSLSMVMLPRLSNVFKQKDYAKMREYINNSFGFVNYLAIPMMFGISGIAVKFAPWFFGSEFEKSGPLMMILSLIIPGIAWASVIGSQYLLAVGKINEFTISVTVGAVLNVMLNLMLIPTFKAAGAAVGTVAAELAVAIIQLYLSRKELPLKDLFKDFWKYLLSGIIMFVVVKIMNNAMNFNPLTLIIQVAVGGATYFVMLIALKSEFNNITVNMLKKILRIRR